MFNRLLLHTFILWSTFVMGQGYSFPVVEGQLKDAETNKPIVYANVLLGPEWTTTDSIGYFSLPCINEGKQLLSISHLSYASYLLEIEVLQDTSLSIYLALREEITRSVVVTAEVAPTNVSGYESLSKNAILNNASQNLSNLLDGLTGVSTLKNGNGISKPVIHGLYGNRIAMLNNGIAQSGQQWGNDHSPEIDPLAANKISVIKGVAALEYQTTSLGSVVLIEPERISKRKGIHGSGSYFFETNGLGHGLNVRLQHYNKLLSWSLVGTLKKSGDKAASNYFLNNTGYEEANIALQLDKRFSKKWHANLYFSSFNTKIGVLKGAHISNLTDLELAIGQEVPFFTEPDFSYVIDAPKQHVSHHLLKLQVNYNINDRQSLRFTYAGQINDRKEFDVRRGGRTETPAMSLFQLTNDIEGRYRWFYSEQGYLKAGVQFKLIDNTNNPETGILPLIPDYLSVQLGGYLLMNQRIGNKFMVEAGARYNYTFQNVATISRTLPRRIVRYNNYFHNLQASAGFKYEPIRALEIFSNIGYASRGPAINELYSFGLHQGISSIEEGDPNLEVESAVKTTLGIKGNLWKRLKVSALGYFQHIHNYIYLNPQDELRLTIRGAFPVFIYDQTTAQLYGFDLSANATLLNHQSPHKLYLGAQYSFIKGRDILEGLSLINIPSNNLSVKLSYKVEPIGGIDRLSFEIHNKYVFQQTDILASQDFLLPPEGYNLLGLNISLDKQFKKIKTTFYVKADNLLNVAYRDYLNRQRYFANDLGINVVIGARLSF